MSKEVYPNSMDKCGELGRQYILKTLTRTADPWNTMLSLQNELGLGPGRYDPGLAFLDALGIPRATIYPIIMERIKNKLEKTFETMSEKDLLLLLNQPIFSKILNINELKTIPINIIKNIHNIPTKYYQLLSKYNLIKELPLNLQRKYYPLILYRPNLHYTY